MKPILFNTEMVRTILEGRKTVTRRVVKDPYYIDNAEVCRKSGMTMRNGTDCTHGMPYSDRPYHPGDILWVRETWTKLPVTPGDHFRPSGVYYYKADEDMRPERFLGNGWHPSIHMPKEAARLFLRVTGVRVERLQDITDYRSEGIQPSESCEECFAVCGGCVPLNSPTGCDNEIETFANLWDSTIKPADLPLYGWEANPWVWVIEFERVSKEAAIGGGGDGA